MLWKHSPINLMKIFKLNSIQLLSINFSLTKLRLSFTFPNWSKSNLIINCHIKILSIITQWIQKQFEEHQRISTETQPKIKHSPKLDQAFEF